MRNGGFYSTTGGYSRSKVPSIRHYDVMRRSLLVPEEADIPTSHSKRLSIVSSSSTVIHQQITRSKVHLFPPIIPDPASLPLWIVKENIRWLNTSLDHPRI